MSEPTFKSSTYQTAKCCRGTQCWCADRSTAEQPCWGLVEVCGEEQAGDEWWWIHACQGHYGVYGGDPYEPEQ